MLSHLSIILLHQIEMFSTYIESFSLLADQVHARRDSMFRQASNTILLAILPIRSISISTTSPFFSHCGGFMNAATPLK